MKFGSIFFMILCTAFFEYSWGQSYFDIANVNYEHVSYSPEKGENFSINRFQAKLNVAFELKNDDLILGNYLGENFKIKDVEYNGDRIDLYSNFLSGGYIHFWAEKKWNLLTQARIKLNSDSFKPDFPNLQLGGWFLFTYVRSKSLSYFAGAYYNQEVNKDLLFPIGGLHWTPSEKWNLYVLIPSTIRFEWVLKENEWYTGIESDWTLNSYLINKKSDINYFRKETLVTSIFIEKHLSDKMIFFGKIGNYQINDFEAYDISNKLISKPEFDSGLIKNVSIQAGFAYRMRL